MKNNTYNVVNILELRRYIFGIWMVCGGRGLCIVGKPPSCPTVTSSVQGWVIFPPMGKSMDEWTIKTPNPKCRLFFKIDLLKDFAALSLTDFIEWRYIHSWLVFSTQLSKCCPHGRRNFTCVLLPLYLLSDLPPPPSQTRCTLYRGVVLNCAVDHILQDSEPTKLLHHPKQNDQ